MFQLSMEHIYLVVSFTDLDRCIIKTQSYNKSLNSTTNLKNK